MFKKIIVLLLSFVICISTLAVPIQVNASEQINEEYRDGFNLVPEYSDSTGVRTDSKYILKTKQEISLDQINKILSIDEQPQPNVELKEAGVFFVTPSKNFEENKLYTFRIKAEDKDDVTWVFQTSSQFKVIRTLPGDKTNNVPINSGIEFYFNDENYEDINSYFEISPDVEGRFERHGKTAVFVPKGFEEGTVYTVKLKKGLKIKDSDKSEIKDDYMFSFETQTPLKNVSDTSDKVKGSIYYTKIINDYSIKDIGYVPINYYIYNSEDKEKSINISSKIYTFNSPEAFAYAVNKRYSLPSWASYCYWNTFTPTNDLDMVLSFNQEINNDTNKTQFIKMPKALPRGYYLLDSYWEDTHFQTFIQVTDTCMYVTKTNNKTLVWLNSLSDKQPIIDAAVSIYGNDEKVISDNQGVASFNTPKIEDLKTYVDKSLFENQLLKVVTKQGNVSFIRYDPYQYSGYGIYDDSNYWNYFSTDRNLYKPDDIINFWGFIQKRYEGEDIKNVTVELKRGYSYYYRYNGYSYYGNDVPLEKMSVDINNGIYQGEFKIPVIEPGGYTLILKKGNELIESKYITIDNYTKPAYKMDVSADKRAVFLGDQVNFEVSASFFEGTGVSDLKLDYNTSNYYLGTSNGSTTTNYEGKANITYIPSINASGQGSSSLYLNVHSQLPETAEISASGGVSVFINNSNVALNGSIKEGKGTIKAKVNKITLDRLNNGTAKAYNDYLGAPIEGSELKVDLVLNQQEIIEDGEYYDFINKVTSKKYKYKMKTTIVSKYSMITDVNGESVLIFDAPRIDNGYYTANINTTDSNGRSMAYNIYIGNDYMYNNYYNDYYSDYYANRYYLDDEKENNHYQYYRQDEGVYGLNENVKLIYKKGNQTLENGRFMYLKLQNGIREFEISDKPELSFDFIDEYIPNMYIIGVWFNGHTYVESYPYNAILDYTDMQLNIEASTDKQSYRPGETVELKVNVKDKNGDPCKAFINASIVDEALFALKNKTDYILQSLFSEVYDGVEYSLSSHSYSGIEEVTGEGGGGSGGGVQPSSQSYDDLKENEDTESSPRADFKDTAFFETKSTDENGVCIFNFKLPDNVTSWRVTLAGVSNDLHAGSGVVNLKVSLPMFINYSLNTTYLADDVPVLGVNAYGDGLKEGEDVTFEVWNSMYPDQKVCVVGKAFERLNIPLWKLEEGDYDIIISAKSSSSLTDSIKQSIKVYNTYHEIEKAVYSDASNNMKLTGGSSGITKLIIKDKSKGIFLPELIHLAYTGGNRIDQRLSRVLASEMINKYFKGYNLDVNFSDFAATDYQRADGGISLLPYDSSDVELTAKLAGVLKDKVDKSIMKDYFYNILEKDSKYNIYALYGLATLKEPVLLKLDKVAKIDNASIKDILYIALAYCEIGEKAKAADLFDDKIEKYVEEYEQNFRINSGRGTDDIMECTAVAANIAAKLGKDISKRFYEYCISNYTNDILINVEKILYISEVVDNYASTDGKLTYNWLDGEKTLTTGKGETYIFEVPSQKLQEFKIVDVQGEIGIVSVFKQGLTNEGKLDENISVSRKYFNINGEKIETRDFKQGDVIRVVITCKIPANAIDDSYEVTDYLPSGLKPIVGNRYYAGIWWYRYKNIDGQKVRFYAYKDNIFWDNTFDYYARVISPGVYKADSAIIQGTKAKDSINMSESEIINIHMADEMSITDISSNTIKVLVDGKEISFDVKPKMKDDRIIVPFRAIFEALGAKVDWNNETETVTGEKGDFYVKLKINSHEANLDGKITTLDVTPTMIEDRTMVPLRFVSESIGARVSWDETTNTVLINTK